MSQATAKNLRELLKKHQQAAKMNLGKNCSCSLKNCILCEKQQGSKVLSTKKINLSISKSIGGSSQVNSQVSTNRQLPETKNFEQQVFLQQQLQIHLTKKKDSKSKLVSSSRHSFYDHMENYLNNYYQSNRSKNSSSSKHKNFQSLINMENEQQSPYVVNKNSFKFNYVIGKGGFGKVWKVEYKKNKKLYALKEMAKTKIIQKKSVNSVLNERYLLENLYHPFLVNLSFAFSDRENLYLALDLLTGGDLRFHLGKRRRFSEAQTKFYVCCILLVLSYLHENEIIHRDLKPENLVLDNEGYLKLTDLGIARLNNGNNSGDTSGTPGYMGNAPEVMCRMDHSVMVDYYALGVISYELMLGRRPYNGRSRQEIKEQILARQVQVKQNEIPCGWTEKAVDFINRLIQRKPEKRLGFNGIKEILQHAWIKDYKWDDLLNKKTKSNYIPGAIDDNFDYQNQISEETQLDEDQLNENKLLLRRKSIQQLFEGYEFDKDGNKKK